MQKHLSFVITAAVLLVAVVSVALYAVHIVNAQSNMTSAGSNTTGATGNTTGVHTANPTGAIGATGIHTANPVCLQIPGHPPYEPGSPGCR